ncbi:TasA family protein [Bacillus sp. SCS-151]|uniref:TasA family protein n=1 Tax=Nanhaiella sioensis TaxID=3115293 RepID=UPI00397A0118
MGIKKKLGLGMASAALGLSLIGGGTFAYFSDSAEVTNTFAAGTLDLSVSNTELFMVDNLKPGDWMERTFTISNAGTLNIKDVLLTTTIDEADLEGDNPDAFANHFTVEFITSDGQTILENKTLAELQGMTPDITTHSSALKNLPVGDTDEIKVKITFVDNGEDQNHFQGDSLEVGFSLEATQEAGEER